MLHVVEKRNDFAIDHQRVRHGDRADQQVAQALGQVGLAAAGRAVQEQRAARIHAGADLVEHDRVDDDAIEHGGHRAARDLHVRHALRLDLGDIGGQRDGAGPA